MSARILNITPAQYHADPCETPSLSSSIAHAIVSESPLHAWNIHPRLGGHQKPPTAATDDGAIVHKLLLGKGAEIVVVQANDFRTNRAKDGRDGAIAAGKIPILEHRYAEIAATAELLREKLLLRGIEFTGQSEVAIAWEEDGDKGPVQCRSMLDHVWLDQGRIIDIKKIRSAHPRQCGRHAVDFGYDIQNAAYKRCLARLNPDLEGRVDMAWVFMELDPPHDIVVARPDGMLSELGDSRWSRAVEIWERCLRTERWPGYAETPVRIQAPPWVIAQEMEGNHGW